MTPGPDLFVVCKQCGSEVSPYITECPYCGHRLRRRAPKLPRANAPTRTSRSRSRLVSLLRRPRPQAVGVPHRPHSSTAFKGWAVERPYATVAVVAASCVLWVVCHAQPSVYIKAIVLGPLHGDWWKLLTYQFAYGNGIYAFVVLLGVAIFGWLLERRLGPAVVLGLFLGAGVLGGLAADAVYPVAVASGGNAGALALVAAWAAPDVEAARRGEYYEGDLLGAGALAALIVAIPFAHNPTEASWLAGVVGGAIGLVLGAGLQRMREAASG